MRRSREIPIPPHNRDAERALLGTKLRDPSIIVEAIGLVCESDFYEFAHRIIYRAILDLHGTGDAVDIVTVGNWARNRRFLDDISSALAELPDAAPCAANYREYAAIIRNDGARRRLSQFADGLREEALDLGESPDVVLQKAERQLREIASPTSEQAIISRPASDFSPTGVDWLWPGRIPCGTLTVLDGDPGLGKSTLALDLAARVSRGSAMPCALNNTDPAGVVVLSAEDDPARTIRPRLEACDADLTRVEIVEAISVGRGDRMPILPYDLGALELLVRRMRARLLIVDPFMAYLAMAIESHKDQSIRLALREIAKLAERNQCAILVIRHLNKLAGGAALYRGGGSIGIIGAARSGLVLAKHPNDPALRVLASTKSNLGPPPRSIVVSLARAGPVAVVAWGREIDLTADELLTQGNPTKRSKVELCADAIREILADGELKSDELDAELKRRCYRPRTIKAARKRANVKAKKYSFDGPWYAALP